MRPTSAAWWAGAIGFWTLVGLLSAGQILWLASRPGERVAIGPALAWQLSYFAVWIPFTPLVWLMAERWPLARLGWGRFLGAHVPLAFVVGAVQATLVVLLAIALAAVPGELVSTIVVSQIRARMPTQIVIYAAILAAAQAALIYARWRDEQAAAAALETELAEARLGMLRAQLHPHVLFNGLHAIAALVRERRNDDAVRVIADTAELLRSFLDTGHARVTLGDEMALVHRYLAIQQVRFGDRLIVDLDLAPGAADVRVPSLVLQPLVENAIRHGLSERVQPGRIALAARRDGDTLVVEVADDGVGVEPGWDASAIGGTGLRNLRARLDAEYRGRATLDVEPGRRPDGGFRVRLRLPWTSA